MTKIKEMGLELIPGSLDFTNLDWFSLKTSCELSIRAYWTVSYIGKPATAINWSGTGTFPVSLELWPQCNSLQAINISYGVYMMVVCCRVGSNSKKNIVEKEAFPKKSECTWSAIEALVGGNAKCISPNFSSFKDFVQMDTWPTPLSSFHNGLLMKVWEHYFGTSAEPP